MGRIRTLKPEIGERAELYSADRKTRLETCFAWLILLRYFDIGARPKFYSQEALERAVTSTRKIQYKWFSQKTSKQEQNIVIGGAILEPREISRSNIQVLRGMEVS